MKKMDDCYCSIRITGKSKLCVWFKIECLACLLLVELHMILFDSLLCHSVDLYMCRDIRHSWTRCTRENDFEHHVHTLPNTCCKRSIQTMLLKKSLIFKRVCAQSVIRDEAWFTWTALRVADLIFYWISQAPRIVALVSHTLSQSPAVASTTRLTALGKFGPFLPGGWIERLRSGDVWIVITRIRCRCRRWWEKSFKVVRQSKPLKSLYLIWRLTYTVGQKSVIFLLSL